MKQTSVRAINAALSLASGVVGAFLLSACAPQAAAASPSADDPDVQAAIDAAVAQERKLYGGNTPVPAVLVGVWDGSGKSYIRAFGEADKATDRALSPADHFRIGSNTKTFVISVLLQLVDEGKLSLDDPLSKFDVGIQVPKADRITVRQMAQMRSGLFEAFDTPEFDGMNVTPNMEFDPRTVIGWAVKQQPYFAPGAGYRYSNTNYLLLGLIIEKVSGREVAHEIESRLIKPFALKNTSYPGNQAMPEPWAHGYGLNGKHDWEDVSGTIPVSLMGAAGEMVSNMEDMRRWVKLYVSGKTNGAETQRARLDCLPIGGGDAGFGLGVACSNGWYGYTGGLPGYNTANFYFPEKDITIVAWATVQADTPKPGVANAIFRDIAKIMAPEHAPLQDQ